MGSPSYLDPPGLPLAPLASLAPWIHLVPLEEGSLSPNWIFGSSSGHSYTPSAPPLQTSKSRHLPRTSHRSKQTNHRKLTRHSMDQSQGRRRGIDREITDQSQKTRGPSRTKHGPITNQSGSRTNHRFWRTKKDQSQILKDQKVPIT